MSPTNASALKPPYMRAAEALRKNDGQWKVYTSTGNCVVLAGPGSGKTKTLTIKLARMLAEDVRSPRGIACITYNNQCARELRQRLELLGLEDGRRVAIGTLHSFCLKHVILPYARLAGLALPDPLNVATTEDRADALAIAVESVLGVSENPADWEYRCAFHRRTKLDRDVPDWLSSDEVAAKVVVAYERAMLTKGVLDFDAMILMGLHLVGKHEWVRKTLRARFPIIAVDEYQDLGHALHRIVLSMLEADVRLLGVGDPDQSIYGFTGADPSLLRELSAREDVELVELKLNYRCGPSIISASEVALGEQRGFVSGSDEPGTIDIHHVPSGVEDQAAFICETIIPAALERRIGRRMGDIAVLYSNQYDGDVVAGAVEQSNWEFIRIDQGNPYPRSPLVYWLVDCAAWCAGGWRNGSPRLSGLIKTWLNFNESVPDGAARRQVQGTLVKFLHSHRMPEELLCVWLNEFRSACLDDALRRESGLREDAVAVDRLAAACDKKGRLSRFTVLAFGGQGGSGTHLNLMTLHSAKGLEFDVVVMMALEEGKLPFRSLSEQRLREARRLFYVGLTRARHEVHLVFSGWYTNRFGRPFRYGPSRFVTEVQRHLQEQK